MRRRFPQLTFLTMDARRMLYSLSFGVIYIKDYIHLAILKSYCYLGNHLRLKRYFMVVIVVILFFEAFFRLFAVKEALLLGRLVWRRAGQRALGLHRERG